MCVYMHSLVLHSCDRMHMRQSSLLFFAWFVLSADDPRKQRGSRSGPTNKSILTWIRAIWHIILYIFFFLFSSNFNCRLKSSQRLEYRKQRGSRSGPTNKSILTWIRAIWHIILYIFYFLFSSNFNCRLKTSQRLEYHIKLLRMQRANSGYFT